MTPDEVLRAIERAWADATPPEPDELAGRPSRIGEYGYLAGFFRGKRWTDVDLRSLRDHYPGPHDACLSFMSGGAFRHFLPSYMRIAILDRDAMDSATDAAVAALTPPRYRPEVDRIAREAHEQMARREPGLDTMALHRAGGTTPEAVSALRAWWDDRVAGFTPAQREAIVAFLDLADQSLADPLAGEALEHWRRQAVSGGDGTER
ncbi:MAG: DUF6714 family protein [Gemmatimonadota bacterium]